ncbi:MAG: hypothetical protein WCT10_05155 [Patescibacteria group bacterium]|jgi:hypothetical protein
MQQLDTKTLKSGVILPAPVVAASYNTIVQILVENPLALYHLQPCAHEQLCGLLSAHDFFYLSVMGVVGDDGYLKADFKEVFDSAVSATVEGLSIDNPVN